MTEKPKLCTWCTNPTLVVARKACTAALCPYWPKRKAAHLEFCEDAANG